MCSKNKHTNKHSTSKQTNKLNGGIQRQLSNLKPEPTGTITPWSFCYFLCHVDIRHVPALDGFSPAMMHRILAWPTGTITPWSFSYFLCHVDVRHVPALDSFSPAMMHRILAWPTLLRANHHFVDLRERQFKTTCSR